MAPRLRWFWLACLCVTFGCYKHHRREDAIADAGDSDVAVFLDASGDSAIDARNDGAVDASGDSAFDAGDAGAVDASGDSAFDAGDAGAVDASDDGAIDAAPIDSGVDAGCSARVPEDFPTLQDAIDLSPCDPIIVTQDQEVSTVTVHRSVTITTPDATQRVIHGDSSGTVLIILDVAVTLERLVISGGQSTAGGGILSYAALTLRDTTVRDNYAVGEQDVEGGGLVQRMGSLRMEGNVVFENNGAEGSSGAQAGAFWLGAHATSQGHLTLRNNWAVGSGLAHGGAIAIAAGSLTAQHLVFDGNRAVGSAWYDEESSAPPPSTGVAWGGAIMLSGSTLSAQSASFTNNTASASAGDVDQSRAIVRGGAIYCMTPSAVTLLSGDATQNVASAGVHNSGGQALAEGGFGAGACAFSLDAFQLEANRATASVGYEGLAHARGGALHLEGGGHALTRVILRNNRAEIACPFLNPMGSPLFGLPSQVQGGAISALNARASVSDSLIASNTATADTHGDLTLASGGGVAILSEVDPYVVEPSAVSIERTSIVNNTIAMDGVGPTVGSGAGVFASEQSSLLLSVAINNSTIAQNQVQAATHRSGLVSGAGIAIENGTLQPISFALGNVTLSANTVDGQDAQTSSPAIAIATSLEGVSVNVNDSIVWGNTLPGTIVDDCGGAVLTGAHNIVSDLGCFATAGVTNRNVDPQLQSMTMVSDRCQVLPIAASSPAHNGGSPGMCSAANGDGAVDQCGRPRNGACDIGALEAQP